MPPTYLLRVLWFLIFAIPLSLTASAQTECSEPAETEPAEIEPIKIEPASLTEWDLEYILLEYLSKAPDPLADWGYKIPLPIDMRPSEILGMLLKDYLDFGYLIKFLDVNYPDEKDTVLSYLLWLFYEDIQGLPDIALQDLQDLPDPPASTADTYSVAASIPPSEQATNYYTFDTSKYALDTHTVLYAFDGTGNNKDNEPKIENTWVSRLANEYQEEKRVYRPGVGSTTLTRLLGGLTGVGASFRLEQAYKQFTDYYSLGETNVAIIGFSRGAAIGREFANMLFERGDGSSRRTVTEQIGKKTITHYVYGPAQNIPDVLYLGLFDTVTQFGIPGAGIGFGIRTGLPANVKIARQAIAKDEKRWLFPCVALQPGNNAPGIDIEEMKFDGDHSDIGRGHGIGSNLLSLEPLYYIWREGLEAGVPFGASIKYDLIDDFEPHDLSANFPYFLFPQHPRN